MPGMLKRAIKAALYHGSASLETPDAVLIGDTIRNGSNWVPPYGSAFPTT